MAAKLVAAEGCANTDDAFLRFIVEDLNDLLRKDAITCLEQPSRSLRRNHRQLQTAAARAE